MIPYHPSLVVHLNQRPNILTVPIFPSGVRSSDFHQHSFDRDFNLEFEARSALRARAVLRSQHFAVHLFGFKTGQVKLDL